MYLIIPCHRGYELSNIIARKVLAFGRDRSGTVADSGAIGARRSRPAGLLAETGLRWCGANAAMNRTEDLHVKVCEEAAGCIIGSACSCCKARTSFPRQCEEPAVDAGSKQTRVIAMLQSPNGATIAAMMKATGWQQHSVRGFLAGVVRKRLKLNLGSEKVDGQRVYQIGSPRSGKS